MAKVIKSFQDKTDGRIYYIGNDYDGERVAELAELGYVEADATEVKEEKPKARKTTKKAADKADD